MEKWETEGWRENDFTNALSIAIFSAATAARMTAIS